MSDELKKYAEGSHCEIWFSDKALKVFKKAPANDRSRLIRILEFVCDEGPQNLNDQQFKAEGRFPVGNGKTVMVYAIKSYQLRIYGVFVGRSPLQLLCPEGAIKKDNKADRKLLERVAKKMGE